MAPARGLHQSPTLVTERVMALPCRGFTSCLSPMPTDVRSSIAGILAIKPASVSDLTCTTWHRGEKVRLSSPSLLSVPGAF